MTMKQGRESSGYIYLEAVEYTPGIEELTLSWVLVGPGQVIVGRRSHVLEEERVWKGDYRRSSKLLVRHETTKLLYQDERSNW